MEEDIDKLNPLLMDWKKVELVKFAVWCAKRVEFLSQDISSGKATAAAEKWLEDPSVYNADAAAKAAYACWSYNWADDSKYFAMDCAGYTANAAAAIMHSYAVECTANAARAAASAEGDKSAKDLLNTYLSELIMNEVSNG